MQDKPKKQADLSNFVGEPDFPGQRDRSLESVCPCNHSPRCCVKLSLVTIESAVIVQHTWWPSNQPAALPLKMTAGSQDIQASAFASASSMSFQTRRTNQPCWLTFPSRYEINAQAKQPQSTHERDPGAEILADFSERAGWMMQRDVQSH